MDNRRMSTSQILAAGILNKKPPATRTPDDATMETVEEGEWNQESLRSGLEKGGLEASMYYGRWSIWKVGDTFSGELMQYRSVTDAFDGATPDEALEKAEQWAEACSG
jgi:hypothetical protein